MNTNLIWDVVVCGSLLRFTIRMSPVSVFPCFFQELATNTFNFQCAHRILNTVNASVIFQFSPVELMWYMFQTRHWLTWDITWEVIHLGWIWGTSGFLALLNYDSLHVSSLTLLARVDGSWIKGHLENHVSPLPVLNG